MVKLLFEEKSYSNSSDLSTQLDTDTICTERVLFVEFKAEELRRSFPARRQVLMTEKITLTNSR